MQAERLNDIKKELKARGNAELMEICLKMAKYKKENKELLTYFLFHSANPDQYINSVKYSLQENFEHLSPIPYQKTKELRKILRLINKHSRFIGSPEADVDLLLWYCSNFLQYSGIRSSQKAMVTILIRQLNKIKKQIAKLHVDLQFDYRQEFDSLIGLASQKVREISRADFEV